MASSLPSLYCSPIESTRLNTQRVTVQQGVSLVLLECSPCVLLTFLMPRPLPRAQSQSAFWPSSALTFQPPPCTPPKVLPQASCVLSSWHFPRPLREETPSQPHPPQVPQDAHSLGNCNQVLSIQIHLLTASLCCPLFCGSPLKTWTKPPQPPQQPPVSVSSSRAHVITKTASLTAVIP